MPVSVSDLRTELPIILEDVTPHVLEINVNAPTARPGKPIWHVLGSVVDAGIEAQFLGHIAAAFVATSYANYVAASDFVHLAGQRSRA